MPMAPIISPAKSGAMVSPAAWPNCIMPLALPIWSLGTSVEVAAM